MTSRERVLAAIGHQETDRPPYCIGFAADGREKLQAEQGITDEEAFLDNDVIRVFPPWWRLKDLDPSYHRPDPPTARLGVWGQGSYEDFYQSAQRWHEAGKYVVACIYGTIFETAYWTRGMDNFLSDMLTCPQYVHALLGDFLRRNLVMLENILWCPHIDGVLLGSDWGTQRALIMSPAAWTEFIRPCEQAQYELIKSYGKHVWLHSCGCITSIIPGLIELGVDVLNPVQPECMDLAYLKREFGRDLTFWGGLSTQTTLPFGTPEEVRQEARAVRDLLGRGGGLIFAPAQELQADVPFANIEALLEVARENTGG